jgi:hypothetical protein
VNVEQMFGIPVFIVLFKTSIMYFYKFKCSNWQWYVIKQDWFKTSFKIALRTGFETGLVKHCKKYYGYYDYSSYYGYPSYYDYFQILLVGIIEKKIYWIS